MIPPDASIILLNKLTTVWMQAATFMYGWNYPWVMTWTAGSQMTTNADDNPLDTPVDHDTIIANSLSQMDLMIGILVLSMIPSSPILKVERIM